MFEAGHRVEVTSGKFVGMHGLIVACHTEGCKVLLDNGYEREFALVELKLLE